MQTAEDQALEDRHVQAMHVLNERHGYSICPASMTAITRADRLTSRGTFRWRYGRPTVACRECGAHVSEQRYGSVRCYSAHSKWTWKQPDGAIGEWLAMCFSAMYKATPDPFNRSVWDPPGWREYKFHPGWEWQGFWTDWLRSDQSEAKAQALLEMIERQHEQRYWFERLMR